MREQGSLRISVAAVACLLCLGSGTASAGIVYDYGNIQYDNVNVNADVLTHNSPLTGYVNNDPFHTPFYFANPHAANGDPIPYLHGDHGAASFEAWQCDPSTDAGCTTSNAHVPFYSMEMYIEPGWGITAMDWKIDSWAGGNDPKGTVTFTAYDVFGAVMDLCSGTNTFALSGGQTGFKLTTCNGEVLYRLVTTMSGADPGMADIKQVSVLAVQTPMPEPGTLALLGLGLAGLAASRRRKQ